MPSRRDAELSEQRSLRRLEKLVRLHLDAREQFDGPEPAGLSGRFKQRERARRRQAFVREGEQDLVSWVPDTSVEARTCAICHSAFGFTHGIRRHHCRLCGRCVCATFAGSSAEAPEGAPTERCSGSVQVNPQTFFVAYGFDAIRLPFGAGPAEEVTSGALTTRMCRECKYIVNRAQYMMPPDDSGTAPHPVMPPTYAGATVELEMLEAQISSALPEFQEMVLGLEYVCASFLVYKF